MIIPLKLSGDAMLQSRIIPAGERIVEPMIDLARWSRQQRIIEAGAKSAELMFELHRRGYPRVSTTANCGLPLGQYDVALIDWRQRSIKALETTLYWLVDFLGDTAVLVVWTDPQEPAGNQTLLSVLERVGLVVEAGSIHKHGCAVSARRAEITPNRKVA